MPCLVLKCLVGVNSSMWFKPGGTMFLWILFLVSATASAPADEYGAIINEGEFLDESSLMHIVPSGYSPTKTEYFIKPALSEIVDKNKPSYKTMLEILEKGHTALGLNFNIYDDNMREAAIGIFRILLDIDDNKLEPMTRYAAVNINKDMFEYAIQLASLYGNKFKKEQILPPFVRKPNHFVNSEALWKAMHLKVAQGMFNEADSKLNQYYKNDNVITINTNYSGWNLPLNGCGREINYFKEDIGLNSYYYGVHLLHPFWMTNDELDQFNPRHAEHYYFTHKQLMARYELEKEHLKGLSENATECVKCDINMNIYNSYLMHNYGLPFPIKSPLKSEWNDERAKLKSIDIAIKECVSRGLLVDNGTAVNMTGEYNIDLVSKLIRANLDSPKVAKIVRSLYGYGGNGFPIDKYNPAPSVLHYPETSLRDHTYWHLLKNLLEYFIKYKNTLEPFDLANYETNNFAIVDSKFTDLRTYFDYYQFKLNNGLGGGLIDFVFTARQRRLQHIPFKLNFSVKSNVETDAVIRLFLAPQCNINDCWNNYDEFFELDVFKSSLKHGVNIISWSSDESERFSSDEFYNMETSKKQNNKYNVFKFPKNLAIPRGSKDGLNLTLFIMITEADNLSQATVTPNSDSYNHVVNEIDKKPLGFPFHRQAIIKEDCGTNCKFYNITIYHETRPIDASGQFSPNLY